MYISAIIRSLGPVKFIVTVIFILLPALELVNGALSVDDLVATMMLLVVVNDLYNSHWKAFVRPDLGLPTFLAGKAVGNISKYSINEIKSVRFIGKVSAYTYLFASKRALVFQEFVRPSECAVSRGKGIDPQLITPLTEKALRLQMIMGFVFLSLLGMSQLSSYYEWIEKIIIPMVMVAWIVALILDIRKKKSHWRKGFKLIYVNLAIIVLVGTMMHLA